MVFHLPATGEPSQSKKSELKFVLLLTLALRLLYSVAAAAMVPFLKLDPNLVASNFTEKVLSRSSTLDYLVIGIWQRFDTLWYLHIARVGYDRPDSIVFYPLYPLLIRPFCCSTLRMIAAALTISTVCSFFLFWGFYRLITVSLGESRAKKALILYTVWPASFIFFAAYPDSLVIALVIWGTYWGQKEKWWLAIALGTLAGFTKTVGALAIAPLVVLGWKQKQPKALASFLCMIGPVAFSVYTRSLAYPSVVEVYRVYWRTDVAAPWTTLISAIYAIATQHAFVTLANLMFLVLVLVPALVVRIRPEFTAFTVTAAALFLTKRSTPILQSTIRYVLALFPVFASFACVFRTRRVFALITLCLFAFNLFLLHEFLNWQLLV